MFILAQYAVAVKNRWVLLGRTLRTHVGTCQKLHIDNAARNCYHRSTKGLKGENMNFYDRLQNVFDQIEKYFDLVIHYIVLLIELIGTVVLVYAIVAAIVGLFKRQPHVRLKLAEGIALALEFKIGGELLRTVVVRDWEELLILGAIILLRAALTFLIQWEIKIERKNGNLTSSQLNDIKTPLTQDDEPPRERGLFGKIFNRKQRKDSTEPDSNSTDKSDI